MDKLNDKIIFLEDSDFDADGRLKYSQYNKPMLVMVGANFCKYCQQMAPVLNALASNNKDLIVGVIKVDGNPNEQKLGQRLGQSLKIAGLPSFLLFRDGTYKKMHSGARTEKALKQFAFSAC